MKLFKLKPLTSKALLMGLGLLVLIFLMTEVSTQDKLDSIKEQEAQEQKEIGSEDTPIEDVDLIEMFQKVQKSAANDGDYNDGVSASFKTDKMEFVLIVLENPNLYDSLSEVEKRNFFRLLSEVPDLSDQMFDGVLKTFNMDMDELNQIVYYLMNGPEKLTYLQSINKLFAEAPEVTSLIIRKHARQFADFYPKKSAKVADEENR